MAVTKAMKSDAAIAAHTPLMPHIRGMNMRNGMRNSNWRVSERKIDSLGLPTLWKKFWMTI